MQAGLEIRGNFRGVARLGLALGWLICSAAWGAPALSGLWNAGELGLVEFSSVGEGKLVAKFRRGGQCNFKPDVQVLTGAFEGNVFVGTVLICQVGTSCQPETTFPFLGVWHENSLSGDVKLDSSCRSPGLDNRRLTLVVATAEEKLEVKKDSGGSAAQIASQKPISKREQQDLAEKALLLGHKKMKEGDFRAAAQSFERGISYAEENWGGHFGLGVAELNLKNTDKALASLQRALQLTRNARVNDAELGEIHYNLACAYSRLGQRKEALAALTKAIKMLPAGTMIEQLDGDPDLNPLRAESEFKRLVVDARVASAKAKRKGNQ